MARAATVYPDRVSVIHGDRRFTWEETFARCRRLASALAGLGAGDTVAVMAPNVPALFEAHFKCPRTVVFGPLPKTSTGKIQKYLLRVRAREMGALPPRRPAR